jgi:hypothetical protein
MATGMALLAMSDVPEANALDPGNRLTALVRLTVRP